MKNHSNSLELVSTNSLELVSKVLIRCFFMNSAVAFVWWLLYMVTCKRFPKFMFDMSDREYSISNYCGIGLLKLLNMVFFLFPYIAIIRVLKKKKES
jgi:hypothetical protein